MNAWKKSSYWVLVMTCCAGLNLFLNTNLPYVWSLVGLASLTYLKSMFRWTCVHSACSPRSPWRRFCVRWTGCPLAVSWGRPRGRWGRRRPGWRGSRWTSPSNSGRSHCSQPAPAIQVEIHHQMLRTILEVRSLTQDHCWKCGFFCKHTRLC